MLCWVVQTLWQAYSTKSLSQHCDTSHEMLISTHHRSWLLCFTAIQTDPKSEHVLNFQSINETQPAKLIMKS